MMMSFGNLIIATQLFLLFFLRIVKQTILFIPVREIDIFTDLSQSGNDNL